VFLVANWNHGGFKSLQHVKARPDGPGVVRLDFAELCAVECSRAACMHAGIIERCRSVRRAICMRLKRGSRQPLKPGSLQRLEANAKLLFLTMHNKTQRSGWAGSLGGCERTDRWRLASTLRRHRGSLARRPRVWYRPLRKTLAMHRSGRAAILAHHEPVVVSTWYPRRGVRRVAEEVTRTERRQHLLRQPLWNERPGDPMAS
jgi:hypothetical protein